MPEKTKGWLRKSGGFGNFLAALLTLLTSNWAVAMSVAIGISAGAWGTATHFFENPRVQIGLEVFLASIWCIAGILYLVDRTKPRVTAMFQDYRYGLTFEGLIPTFIPTNFGSPDPGALNFGIQLRNFSSGPIKYVLESLDVRLGSRTTPKYKAKAVTGYMAKGAARQAQGEGFPSGSMQEYFGKGTITGTADFSVLYGPPDGVPVRRLKISIELKMAFPSDGAVDISRGINIGYFGNIAAEDDEALE